MTDEGIIKGASQILAVLSCYPVVFWLKDFILSPSIVGGLLVVAGIILGFAGVGFCVLMGGIDVKPSPPEEPN